MRAEIERLLARLRERTDKAFQTYLRELERIRASAASWGAGMDSEQAQNAAVKALVVFRQAYIDAEQDWKNAEEAWRSRIAGVTRGIGPVTEDTRTLAEALRDRFVREVEGYFSSGAVASIMSRWGEIQEQGDEIDRWIFREEARRLAEVHGLTSELMRLAPELMEAPAELVQARELVAEQETVLHDGWKKWEEIRLFREMREAQAQLAVENGEEQLVALFGPGGEQRRRSGNYLDAVASAE
jgi:hypothetical protein